MSIYISIRLYPSGVFDGQAEKSLRHHHHHHLCDGKMMIEWTGNSVGSLRRHPSNWVSVVGRQRASSLEPRTPIQGHKSNPKYNLGIFDYSTNLINHFD